MGREWRGRGNRRGRGKGKGRVEGPSFYGSLDTLLAVPIPWFRLFSIQLYIICVIFITAVLRELVVTPAATASTQFPLETLDS